MFSNKGFGWKLAGAAGLILALGALSAARGPAAKPSAVMCLAEPGRWDGREVWVASAPVLSVGAGGFVLEAGGLPFRVDGTSDVRPGEVVGVSGTFEAAGRRLRLRELKRHEGGGHRTLMVLVSIAVLAVVLGNFLRHFAFRPRLTEVEGAN
jgi:hypothetical protein